MDIVIDTPLSRTIIFGILLPLMILSIICSLFILYHFARSGELRKRISNHFILALLSINLIQTITEMPLTLIVLHTGFVAVQSPVFCLFWPVYNYALIVIGLMFMAYACIERYFLIFYRVFFNKHLILLHYGPLVFFLIYPPVLYFGLIVLYPCETDFDYTQFVCGGACYQFELALGLYDWLSNVCGPVVVGAIATTALIVRVLLQKRRVGQQAIWRRNRKMVLQLASVSIMYIVVWIPSVVCFVVPLIVPNPLSSEIATAVLNYFQYMSCLLCPFMCLVGLPEVRGSIKHIFIQSNTVQPLAQNQTAMVIISPQRQQEQKQSIPVPWAEKNTF